MQVQANQSPAQAYYNVREWIVEYDKKVKPEKKLEAVLDSGVISEIQRQALVRVVVGKLSDIIGNLYPSSEIKELTAQSIITSFEKLKSPLGKGYVS